MAQKQRCRPAKLSTPEYLTGTISCSPPGGGNSLQEGLHLQVGPSLQRLQHCGLPAAGLWALQLWLLRQAGGGEGRPQVSEQSQQEAAAAQARHPRRGQAHRPLRPGPLPLLLPLLQRGLLVRLPVTTQSGARADRSQLGWNLEFRIPEPRLGTAEAEGVCAGHAHTFTDIFCCCICYCCVSIRINFWHPPPTKYFINIYFGLADVSITAVVRPSPSNINASRLARLKKVAQ